MKWLTPWHATTGRGEAEAELKRVLAPNHVLFGVAVRAVGYRQDKDDVAFELLDGTSRIAVDHLTAQEQDSAWPATRICDGWSVFAEAVAAD